jgi:hypothetical protein
MNPLIILNKQLTGRQRRAFRALNSPAKIQSFLDSIPYCARDLYRSPLSIFQGKSASCLDGALMASLLLRRLGHPPMILELVAEDDDDHIIALYRRFGLWAALAKSEFAGLRSREPVFRTLRELVLSYFPSYYNARAEHTLRAYTVPLKLEKFDSSGWVTCDKKAWEISRALDRQRQVRLLSARIARNLHLVDKRIYESEIAGSAHERTYRFYKSRMRKPPAD